MFAGNCTRWEGSIDGEKIKIEGDYKKTQEVDTRKTKPNDMLGKMLGVLWNCTKNRSSRYVYAKGCPVSVADHVNYLSSLGKIKNPNFDPRLAVGASLGYWQMRFHRLVNRFLG